jgi:hypothetical protein
MRRLATANDYKRSPFHRLLTFLEAMCFERWDCLSAVTFEPDSKLVVIDRDAFLECYAPASFIIPASAEFIGESCFQACSSLRKLIFASPCHLRQLLSLPQIWPGSHDIPDSVEKLAVWGDNRNPCTSELHFGHESKLKRILMHSPSRTAPVRSFLQFSSRSLKDFQSRMEFEEEFAGRNRLWRSLPLMRV